MRRGPIGAGVAPPAIPATPAAPADNPITPAKVALGRLLFWDPILSGPRDVACAPCHHPEFGYADARDLSIGVNGRGLALRRRFAEPNAIPFVKRNSQTILNTAFIGLTDRSVTSAILRAIPPSMIKRRQDLPRELDQFVIEGCLAKEPKLRVNMREFNSVIDRYSGDWRVKRAPKKIRRLFWRR